MNLFIRIFEENKLSRALARFIGLLAVLWAAAASIQRVKEWIDPFTVHLVISVVALAICAFALITIYNRIYGKLSSEVRIFRHPLLTYNKALVRAIRLSSIDDSYFIAVTWLKFSRVVVSIPLVAALLLVYEMDNHSHLMVVPFLGKAYAVHSIFDNVTIAAIISLTFFSLWQIAEINLISRGTASLVNKRSNAKVRARNAAKRAQALRRRN